jgi:hypothetical protein
MRLLMKIMNNDSLLYTLRLPNNDDINTWRTNRIPKGYISSDVI